MIKFNLKESRFILLRRSKKMLSEPVSDWAGMRWIVFAVSGVETHQSEILESYQRLFPWICFQDEINDIEIASQLDTRGLCIAHVELIWNIARGLVESNLGSDELIEYCDVRKHSLNAEILNAVQSTYTAVASEFDQSQPIDMAQQLNLLPLKINLKAQSSYISPSTNLTKFFFLVLNHVHWFAVGRFQRAGQVFGDGPCSIWLNHDEFQINESASKYMLPIKWEQRY